MLVVSRKKNESIVISDDLEVVVVEIQGDTVQLGIVAGWCEDAPSESPPPEPPKEHSPSPSKTIVLSRKKNESIVISDEIMIIVVEIRGDKVRLAVEAPLPMTPQRREEWEARRRESE